MILVFAGLIGVVIGSFLSVIVTRYESEESIVTGRSHCCACGYVIHWYDNVPLVSYIMLRGRCRDCGVHISLMYPLLELVTAATFVGIAYFVGVDAFSLEGWIIVLWSWLISAGLIAVFFYDARTMQIPMLIVWSVVVLIVLYMIGNVLFPAIFVSHVGVVERLIGGGVGFCFLYALSALSCERWMGAGDAYLGLIGGLLVGWPAVLFFLTASFGLGAVIAIVLLAIKVRSRKDAVPFAPFLIFGIMATYLFPVFFPETALMLPYF